MLSWFLNRLDLCYYLKKKTVDDLSFTFKKRRYN